MYMIGMMFLSLLPPQNQHHSVILSVTQAKGGSFDNCLSPFDGQPITALAETKKDC